MDFPIRQTLSGELEWGFKYKNINRIMKLIRYICNLNQSDNNAPTRIKKELKKAEQILRCIELWKPLKK